jgi:hypothetical protein
MPSRRANPGRGVLIVQQAVLRAVIGAVVEAR